jgi:hypothetical protein
VSKRDDWDELDAFVFACAVVTFIGLCYLGYCFWEVFYANR